MAKSEKATATTAMATMKETGLMTSLDTLKKGKAAISNEMDGLLALLEQIKIPIGSMTSYKFFGEDPEQTETVKEFSAVILYHHLMRTYYKEKYEDDER